MKISFRKIPKDATPFTLKGDELECKGTFRQNGEYVDLKMKINGSYDTICDSCGDEYKEIADDSLEVRVIDGYYKGDEIDIIEMHDGVMDLDAIFEGEIESLKSGYHYCSKCK